MSWNKMKQVYTKQTPKKFAMSPQTVLFLPYNKWLQLLTELVRSVQEDTAGLVLFSLLCGPRLRLGQKKRIKNSIVQYPPTYLSLSQ